VPFHSTDLILDATLSSNAMVRLGRSSAEIKLLPPRGVVEKSTPILASG